MINGMSPMSVASLTPLIVEPIQIVGEATMDSILEVLLRPDSKARYYIIELKWVVLKDTMGKVYGLPTMIVYSDGTAADIRWTVTQDLPTQVDQMDVNVYYASDKLDRRIVHYHTPNYGTLPQIYGRCEKEIAELRKSVGGATL